jgi:hypothetical protein
VTITDILIDIQQHETGAPLDSDVTTQLRELAVEFGVEDNPGWLLPIFEAVRNSHAILSPVFFEKESSDPSSYLAEVEALLKWKYEDEGEYESIEFPKLGWRIYISNESHSPTTGRGGSTYQVTALQSKQSDRRGGV